MENLMYFIRIIEEAHADQYDKQGVPYIFHLWRVAIHWWHDQEMFLIALGHDMLEDTSVTEDGLHMCSFSNSITEGIKVLTHRKNEPYQAYIQRIMDHPDKRLKAIKRADIEDNMSRLHHIKDDDTWERLHNKYTNALEMLNSAETRD